MKPLHSTAALLIALTYPLATSSQRHHGGGPGRPPPGFPGFASITPPTNPPTVTPTVLPNTVQNTFQNTEQNTLPNTVKNTLPNTVQNTIVNTLQNTGFGGNPTTTAAGPVDSGTGNNPGGGKCAAVQGNMNVQVSGANVDFRFDPPVAGNPTTGKTGDCGVWTFPRGWSGRVHVGGGDGAPKGGTLYEGNINKTTGIAAMDVSFVEGFSVPMICTDNGNGFVSGCGIDLFTLHSCPTGGSAGGVCKNPQGPGGTRDSAIRACEACSPPDPFFGPCAAAAIVFPTDDAANDGISSLNISCTIGVSSQRTGREGDTETAGHPEAGRCSVCGSSKRSLEDVLFGRGVEAPVIARSPSMLPRVHKKSTVDILGRRSHQHGMVAREGKIR